MTDNDSTRSHSERAQYRLERLADQVERLPSELPMEDSDAPPGEPSIAFKLLAAERYSGAFPHPDILTRFDRVIENGAERAFALTEREQAHRHSIDRTYVDAAVYSIRRQAADRRLLIIFAFSFLTLSLGASIALAIMDKPIGATVAGGASVLALVAALVASMKDRAPEIGSSPAHKGGKESK